MVVYNDRFYDLRCDCCGVECGRIFPTFEQAVAHKKEYGWISQKRSEDEWEDICPECQDAGE